MTAGRMQTDSNRLALLSIWYIYFKYGTYGIHAGGDGFLLFLLGINDIPAPVEAILPRAAQVEAAKRAYDRAYGGANTSPAARQAYTQIRRKRVDAALETLSFVRRLATAAKRHGHDGALAVLILLARRDDNDTSLCSDEDYQKYVLKFLGEPRENGQRSFSRNVLVRQLEAYDEEARNGGARAACGVGASDATKKRLRKRVRDAAFPRRIIDARSAPKALEWASGLFGGNLLPKKGEPDYAKIVQKFRDVRKLYKNDDSD